MSALAERLHGKEAVLEQARRDFGFGQSEKLSKEEQEAMTQEYVDIAMSPQTTGGAELDELSKATTVRVNNGEMMGKPFNGLIVATFSDDQNPAANMLAATIDWGDGGSSGGNIQLDSPGAYTVTGGHIGTGWCRGMAARIEQSGRVVRAAQHRIERDA